MNERQRILFLVVIMMLVALVVGGVSLALLYRTALTEEKARLVETAQSQARFLEAVARFNQAHNQDYPGGPELATLAQFREARRRFEHFGETGEFTLARRQGDDIVFLRHRQYDLDQPTFIPFDSELAEPMRLSLSGQRGTVIGLDYRGKTVLAAYEPVEVLDMGIVAKIDLDEVQKPFVEASITAGLVAMTAVLLGALLFFRVTDPLLKNSQESELLFRNTFEQAAVGIAHTTPEGRFIRINQRFCDIVGYSRDEMLALTFQDLTHSDDLETNLECVQRALAGELQTYALEKRYIRKDGSCVWVNLTVALVREPSGEPKYSIGVVQDISQRKRAEAALQQYSERLEDMVKERTRELQEAQEQLVRRERLAVLGQLAGGVGHELRNPLAAIKNSVYFLNMVLENPEPDVGEALGILTREVETSENIISSLLDFARSRAPVRRKVDLNHAVQEALARTDVPQNVEVKTQLDQALPTILADPDQLGQVFGNLILNAVQAMTQPSSIGLPQGGRLNIQSLIPFPDWVSVSFADTGVGIPPENLHRLFEPLFTTKAKGIGLGLAIVKALVERHGGKVEVQSEVGQGSTFTVSLPESPQNDAGPGQEDWQGGNEEKVL
jgi:PAS domain S-box-containing protein